VPALLKRHLFYGENWLEILLVPLRVFFQGRDDDMQHFDGVLNPILLILLPFAFRVKNSDIGYMKLFSIFYFLLVFFTADMQIRFLLPILPLLIILTVTGIKQVMDFTGTKSIVATGVALLLSLNLVYLIYYFKEKEPLPYLKGMITRDEYLLKHQRGYTAIRYINQNLPLQAKILMVYTGDRGYYIEREYYYNSYLSGQPLREPIEGSKNALDVARKIKGTGATHILMDERIFDEFIENNLDERQKLLYYDFLKGYLTKLHASDGYILYEISGVKYTKSS